MKIPMPERMSDWGTATVVHEGTSIKIAVRCNDCYSPLAAAWRNGVLVVNSCHCCTSAARHAGWMAHQARDEQLTKEKANVIGKCD